LYESKKGVDFNTKKSEVSFFFFLSETSAFGGRKGMRVSREEE
jgi:hypothetical protein